MSSNMSGNRSSDNSSNVSSTVQRRNAAASQGSRLLISEASRIADISRAANWLLIAIALAFVSLAIWAAVAEVDTVAQATGKVIPSARVQVMQSLEGGVVTAIHVRQGQRVEAGAALIDLSPLAAEGDLRSRRQQALALDARVARLRAEADGGEPVFAAALSRDGAEFVRVERSAFSTRRTEQSSQAAMLTAQTAQKTQELEEARVLLRTSQQTLAAARSEREIVEKLVAQGLEPKLELIRLDRTIGEADGRAQGAKVAIERLTQGIVEARARRDAQAQFFRAAARDELNRVIGELRALEQGLPALADRFERTALKAPVAGIVNRVLVTTIGGVARPGDPLLELVPGDDQLVVEALVSPRDIGFISVGQKARVRVTAFDYSIYGAMAGEVVQVGADALTNERGEAFYVVRVQTALAAITNHGKSLPIIPGMQTQVDIVTGSKTVANYLLKPLISVREGAFGER